MKTEICIDIEEPAVRLNQKRGIICFIKTDVDRRTHFFTTDRHQDNVPDDFMPLRFPNWTKEEAIKKFLYDSIEIKNPNPEHQS
jgi:hypothetical protein